ncbi:MAG: hypothetical protein KDE51_16685 [Anaerolineales bacterium]|nr:hypothetical protein [Anaerolineales bacterium]
MSRFLPRITPRSVTITRWGVFILGIANGWQAAVLYQQAAVLQEFAPVISPTIRIGLAAVWAVLLCLLAGAIWWRRPWVRTAVPVALIAYTLYHLAMLVIAESSIAKEGWLGDLLLGLTGAAFSIWALRRSAVASYFQQ